MGERETPVQNTALFDSPPKGLDVGQTREEFDGTFDRWGISVTLDYITGKPLRAVYVDLYGVKDNIRFEPLERADWASNSRDIEPGTLEFAKLDAIVSVLRTSLLARKAQRPQPRPMREWTIHPVISRVTEVTEDYSLFEVSESPKIDPSPVVVDEVTMPSREPEKIHGDQPIDPELSRLIDEQIAELAAENSKKYATMILSRRKKPRH